MRSPRRRSMPRLVSRCGEQESICSRSMVIMAKSPLDLLSERRRGDLEKIFHRPFRGDYRPAQDAKSRFLAYHPPRHGLQLHSYREEVAAILARKQVISRP